MEVAAEVVTRESDSLVQKYQKMARIPGFRRGKVPASVIRQRFGEDLKSEIVEHLVPKYLQEEFGRQGLKPVSQPRVTDLQIQEGEPLRFKATFEVLPEIEVAGYEELRAEHQPSSVSDEEVEQAVASLREHQATFTAIDDRPLEDGDFAQIGFTGTPKPAALEVVGESKPVEVDDVMFEVGGANSIKEFSENLRGARPGEERNFEVIYPADFADED